MEFGGLVIEVLIIFGIPILIPTLIILCAGKLSYNEKIKNLRGELDLLQSQNRQQTSHRFR